MSDHRLYKLKTPKQRVTKILREKKCYQAGADGGAEKRCSKCRLWYPFLKASGYPVTPSAFCK